MNLPKKNISQSQVLLKLENFCAYQERSQQEVRNKLYQSGIYGEDAEFIIAELIQSNFINEERFAIAYTSGKFRIKHWGRLKIRQGLKQKGLSEKMISNALKKIDAEDYYQTLLQIIDKKTGLLHEKSALTLKNKLLQYASGKGFERDLIFEVLKDKGL